MWKSSVVLVVVLTVACLVSSAPQSNPQENSYEPYQYEYKVEDAEQKLFFDKNEVGDGTGKVNGKYSVWLPDGRLMTVEYSVDKDTGFVPKISFEDNANPIKG